MQFLAMMWCEWERLEIVILCTASSARQNGESCSWFEKNVSCAAMQEDSKEWWESKENTTCITCAQQWFELFRSICLDVMQLSWAWIEVVRSPRNRGWGKFVQENCRRCKKNGEFCIPLCCPSFVRPNFHLWRLPRRTNRYVLLVFDHEIRRPEGTTRENTIKNIRRMSTGAKITVEIRIVYGSTSRKIRRKP